MTDAFQPEKLCDAVRSKLPPAKMFQVFGSKNDSRLIGDATCEMQFGTKNSEDTAIKMVVTADSFIDKLSIAV